jgi:hypothetical protein
MSCIILDSSICFSAGEVGSVSVSGSSRSDKPFCSSQWYHIECVLYIELVGYHYFSKPRNVTFQPLYTPSIGPAWQLQATCLTLDLSFWWMVSLARLQNAQTGATYRIYNSLQTYAVESQYLAGYSGFRDYYRLVLHTS